MSLNKRGTTNTIFTALTYASVVLLAMILLIILVPMIIKGSSAVFFYGTVEFRKMQHDLFDRSYKDLKDEIIATERARMPVYQALEKFKRGIDPDSFIEQAKDAYREYGEQLRYKEIRGEQYRQLRSHTRKMRKTLVNALQSTTDPEQIQADLQQVLANQDNPAFEGTAIEKLFEIAREYSEIIKTTDLSKRREYEQSLTELQDLLSQLFGPLPGQPEPQLDQNKYGATRQDQTEALMHRIMYKQKWVSQGPGKPLVQKEISRREIFAGTIMEPVFGLLENNIDKMMNPQFTFYWRYYIQDNKSSHYFGGIGPEILGTLILTLVAMAFAAPLGVISAAYLVECSSEGWIVRIIRMCINTLAGVPSIVFGLFGLAFFILILFPLLGWESKPCILAASMTLAVLTLPVIIRASEEAIRSVPRTYKEASLGLGASQFKTFMKVTLPAAMPGILTGFILSLSRVAGETAPILFTGAAYKAPVPDSLFQQTRTLSYGSWAMAVGDRIAAKVPHNQWGMVVTLVGLILILNALSIWLRSILAKRLRGQ